MGYDGADTAITDVSRKSDWYAIRCTGSDAWNAAWTAADVTVCVPHICKWLTTNGYCGTSQSKVYFPEMGSTVSLGEVIDLEN